MSEQAYENTRPCIGIFSMLCPPPRAHMGKYFLWQVYVQAIEAAGGNAILLKVNQPESYYREMFKKINGLFLPGGTSDVYDSPMRTASQVMVDLSIEANDAGDYFPIWGTCLGIQLLAVMADPDAKLVGNHSLKFQRPPLDFTEDFRESKLFSHAPEEVIASLRDHKTTYNSHKRGVTWEKCRVSKAFTDFYQVLSTNVDEDGKLFVSTMEARNYPFYAVQWHPEKNAFDKVAERDIDKSKRGVAITHYLHCFFVNQARKNNHHFDSGDDEFDHCMDNHCRKLKIHARDGVQDAMYFFNEDDY